jgi:vanillate O-demethylase ferredoxin subunit
MPERIKVQVAEVQALTPLVRRLVLQAADGKPLPGFTAGAHVRVEVALAQGRTDWRHYSLVRHAGVDAALPPATYELAVRREEEGRGGSAFMHALQPGDHLSIEPPKNDFPLSPQARRVLLVAGGIGVTPLLSMATELRAAGRDVRMVYAGRSRGQLAYLPQLEALLGDALAVHADDEAGRPLDVAALLAGCAGDEQVYVCGPKPLLDAVLALAASLGWPKDRVRFELFGAAPAAGGDAAFEVVLSQSGASYQVPAGQSILDCLIEQGCDPLYDCQRGECGVCAVPVLEGEVDHRDYVLSESEKAAGKVIHICVSRARGPRLVLDL